MSTPTPPLGVPYLPTLGEPFSNGYQSGRGPMSEGLAAQGARWTALGQQSATRPTSVIQQLQPSPNGLSARDAQRELPSGELLSTGNGQSEGAAESGRQMLMRGVENQFNAPTGMQP
jgi:hypothetical protein